MVEAIAAGCLVIGNPESLGRHSFMLTERTSAVNADEACQLMRQLDDESKIATAERDRQQQLTEYLCYARPMNDLVAALQRKRKSLCKR